MSHAALYSVFLWIPPLFCSYTISWNKSYRGNVDSFKLSPLQLLYQDNEMKLGESKETHCICTYVGWNKFLQSSFCVHYFAVLQFCILREENCWRPITGPFIVRAFNYSNVLCRILSLILSWKGVSKGLCVLPTTFVLLWRFNSLAATNILVGGEKT